MTDSHRPPENDGANPEGADENEILIMGCLKKKRKTKINKHKRRKRMKANRHKKRLRYKG